MQLFVFFHELTELFVYIVQVDVAAVPALIGGDLAVREIGQPLLQLSEL